MPYPQGLYFIFDFGGGVMDAKNFKDMGQNIKFNIHKKGAPQGNFFRGLKNT